MRVPTTINPGPRSTDLERLDREIESHPIWTELRGPVTGLEPAFTGERIDTFMKESVAGDPALRGLDPTARFKFGPDFRDPATGSWYDATTPGEWARHVGKYGPGGIPVFYG